MNNKFLRCVVWVAAAAGCIGTASAELADGKFGGAQVFDAQRSPALPVAGANFTVSSFARPFDSALVPYTIAAGQYIRFVKVTDTPCRYGITLYNADDTVNRVVQASGAIYGLGSAGFLHNSIPGNSGTFVTSGTGYSLGGGLSYVPATGAATCADTAAYVPSTTPTNTAGPIVAATPPSIPTLSEWALLLLAGLVGLAAFGAIQRRKR